LSYSGRWDITNAVKKIVATPAMEKIKPEHINDELISKYLSTKDIPDPDLLIRTSGDSVSATFALAACILGDVYHRPLLA